MWNPKYKRISGPVPIYWAIKPVANRSIHTYADGSGFGPYFVKLDGKWREVKKISSPRAGGKRWVLVGSHGEYTKYINAPASNPYPLPKYVKKV